MKWSTRIEVFAEIPKKPDMVVFSGGSGSGKGTILRRVFELDSGETKRSLSISWTTRDIRPGESPDAYVFASRVAFEAKIASGGFMEWTEYMGNYYGTPVPDEDTGQLIAEIEVKGAEQLLSAAAGSDVDARFAFLLAGSPDRLRLQLMDREDGVAAEIKEGRLRTFYETELPAARALGAHMIINTSPGVAAYKLHAFANGVYFCDPDLPRVIDAFEQEGKRLLSIGV